MDQGDSVRRRFLIVAAATVFGLCLAGTAAWGLLYLPDYLLKRKLQIAHDDFWYLQRAITECGSVDCHYLYPLSGNYLPTALTTPHAFIQSLPLDPFSPNRETYRYIPQDGWAHGSGFLVASRGPDGDWDIDRLPDRMMVHGELWLHGPLKYKSADYGEIRENPFSNLQPYFNLEYYITADGRWVDVPAHEVTILPKPLRDGMMTTPEIIEHCLKNNVALYDPTNGLRSDGDIIQANYDPYRPRPRKR